jgi:hypothetical protein
MKRLRDSLLPLFLWLLTLLLPTPVAHAQTAKWKIMVLGDTRGTSTSDQINTTILTELADEIVAQSPAFIVISGDLVYSGTLSAFQTWKSIMTPVYQAGIGVYPVMGNHDANAPAYFIEVFGPDLPDNGPAGEVNRTYAISHNNALILGLDTYVNPGRVNQPWIDSVLGANTLPHVFAFGHMPAFKANHTDCLDDYASQRDAFWTSLRNAGGRSYFCGHDHFYDRMRVGDGDADPNNDLHQLIVGGGGAPLTGGFAYDGANTTWTPTPVYHDMQYGYTVVEVDGPAVTMTYFHRTGAETYVATSEVWSYTVPTGPIPPPAPLGLTATTGNAMVALNWQPSAGADGYNVYRAASSSSGAYSPIARNVTAPNHTDTTVVNGTTYYYYVTAVSAVGESAPSAYIGATPQGPPAAPTLLSAVPRKGQVKLTWTAAMGATSYKVQRSDNGGTTYAQIKSGVTSLTYTDSKLAAGKTYYYRVLAVNSAGDSPPSPPLVAVVK